MYSERGPGRAGFHFNVGVMVVGDSIAYRHAQSGAGFLGGKKRGAQLIQNFLGNAMALIIDG